MIRTRRVLAVAVLGTSCVWGVASCSSDSNGGSNSTGGAANVSGSAGTAAAVAGMGGGGASPGGGAPGFAGAPAAGGGGTAGAPSGGAGTAGGAGAATGGASGGSSVAGAAGMIGLGGGTHTSPTCVTPTPTPNPTGGHAASECDYLLQSLDFDSLGYTTTPDMIKTTAYGQAFGLSAINNCSPYCYQKNLTVGVDIVGGNSATTQGEIIVEFPATGGGLPITVADATRNILGWITFAGAAKPTFEIDVQMVLETVGNVIVPSADTGIQQYFKPGGNKGPFGPFSTESYNAGSEFKFFGADKGFPNAPKNVTGMGFRLVAKATAGQEWHGVVYIDHLQIRAGQPKDPTDKGPFPFGLN